jgi:HK97 family phage prohead protease
MKTVVRTVLTPVIKRQDIKNRTIRFIGTTESEDRTGDVIEVDGWELSNFTKNPVFLWDHTPSLGPIGKVKQIIREGASLLFDVEFASKEVSEFADRMFKLFEAGFLNAVSVGFIPKEFEPIIEEDGFMSGLRFTKQELLELSAVSIPAHQDAVALSAYKKAMDESEEYVKAHQAKDGGEETAVVTLEQFSKTALAKMKPEANEEDEEAMKEELEVLKKQVAELEATVKGLLDLRETVDLSKSAMSTLNTLFAEKLSKNETHEPVSKSGASDEGQEPTHAFDPNALTGALTSLLEKVQSKSTGEANFKTQGDK